MRLFGWLLSISAFLGILGLVAVVGVLNYFSQDLPGFEELENYEPSITTRLYSDDGQLMAEYAIENRLFVPIEAIPAQVREAFISVEDADFANHIGIDFTGIARAAINNVQNIGTGRPLEGASTITQQVARNFLLTSDQELARKIREQLLAVRMERIFTKDEILELYLNQIYLGRGAYGVAAAALAYFDKSLAELTLEETAYLAALPKAPNNYHPTRRTEAAIARRNYVVERMLAEGYVAVEEANPALEADLNVVTRDAGRSVTGADYFSEEVRRELQRTYGNDQLYEGGLMVRTTLDPRMQEIADRVLREGLLSYDRRHGWRGPIGTLPNFDGWPNQLAAFQAPEGAGSWRPAAVLEVQDDRIRIGFEDREQGIIRMEESGWAREVLTDQRYGAEPRTMSDIVALGDVILTSPGAGTDEIVPIVEGEPRDPLTLPVYLLEQIPNVQGALVAMDPYTGRVKALAGGYSFDLSEFNRATQAVRQPGSSIKPFVYLTALEAGYTPSTIILDTPLAVDLGAGQELYRPSNYGNDYLGAVPLRRGIELSRNIMTVRLLMEIGLEPVQEITQRVGIYAEEMELFYSMALGAGETTPMQMAAAYSMLVNGGRQIDPTIIDRIQNRTGETIFRHDSRVCPECSVIHHRDDVGREVLSGPQVVWTGQETPELPDERPQLLDEVAAYQMVSMLQGVVQRGTAARLSRLGLPLAGKTGTTNDAFDGWFVGFSPTLAVAVYVGFDNPRTLGPRETGGSTAAPIFGAFMDEALIGDARTANFRIPQDVSLVRVDSGTGLLAEPGAPSILEAFRQGTEPRPGDVAITISGGDSLPLAAFGGSTGAESTTQGTGGLY